MVGWADWLGLRRSDWFRHTAVIGRHGFHRCKNGHASVARVSECRTGGAGPVLDHLLRLLNDSGGGSVPASVLHRHHKVVTALNRQPPTRGPEQYLT